MNITEKTFTSKTGQEISQFETTDGRRFDHYSRAVNHALVLEAGYTEDLTGRYVDKKGKPIEVSKLRELKEQRTKSEFNKMVGNYVENGYTFIRSDVRTGSVVFYHHANNQFQDDIVFVEAIMSKGVFEDRRTLISRHELLQIAEDMKDIESKKRKEDDK